MNRPRQQLARAKQHGVEDVRKDNQRDIIDLLDCQATITLSEYLMSQREPELRQPLSQINLPAQTPNAAGSRLRLTPDSQRFIAQSGAPKDR